jgi:formylmethanofuran:tetrahydromethanopterin formyltransferase
MTLHKDYAGLKRVMSLQHWQDGRIGWVCQSCNSRMRNHEELPPEGMKRCHACEVVKSAEAFYENRTNFGAYLGVTGKCRQCSKRVGV